MEELRQKLYNCIEQYGNTDERTVQVSQELDKLVVADMKGEKQCVTV